MKLSGAEAVRFCQTPQAAYWAFLLFGDDEGVVADGFLSLKQALFKDRDDLDVITLDDDEVKKDPAALMDALDARSLLGNPRLIRIRANGDKAAAPILEAIQAGDQAIDRFESPLVITAGALQKRSKLRAGSEAAKHAAALHLFSDETQDLVALVRARLAEDGLEIEEMALERLVAGLPGHRSLANQ
ncbi:MAG: hypothetical protein AAFQ84_04575, partial [Pseudomonadota bacterium]